jgi:uncharacterized repeat protein (TIGR03847 family)
MARIQIELDPVSHITTDAIGKPGQRVFYLQGRQGDQVVTLLIEKIQVQTMAIGVEHFLSELNNHFDGLSPASEEFDENQMHIHPPVDPLFRVGELGLAYDSERDLACLIAHEMLSEEQSEDEAGEVRFWCTRSQLRAMSAWGSVVVNRGRPICPQCGEPMDPEGHFCPKKNGHKH